MKKVLIIGAGGSLAKYVIEVLKASDNVELSLFARNKKRISNPENATIIEGDAMDYDNIKNARLKRLARYFLIYQNPKTISTKNRKQKNAPHHPAAKR